VRPVSRICSGIPPTAEATTGRAQNIASRMLYGNPSDTLDSTTRSPEE
jgi:hypothetical protein